MEKIDGATDGLRVVWEGPQASVHSFALVNRELCLKLLGRGLDLTVDTPDTVVEPPELARAARDRLDGAADVHVRHEWPPSFEPPASGHWVVMQPWEFGSPPSSWVEPMRRVVDEVWAYSRFVRDSYIAAGVPGDRVHVIPLGVDPDRFRPQAPAFPLATRKGFRFLFVGGTIARKGIDILLNAYALTFRASDDVCLVIKDVGSGSFYRGMTAEGMVAQFRAMPDYPEIEYIDRALAPSELAGLYTACDCLVHPYRGEGFGLPIAEAMACGLPTIVTGYGAAMDFCDAGNSYPILARTASLAERKVGDLETVDLPWMAQPEMRVVADLMRHVVEDPDDAFAKGDAASAHIRGRFTWSHAADAVEHRLSTLVRRPIRRLEGD